MRIGNLCSLAIKYLHNYFRRYVFLLFILFFSFGIITTITTLTEGMSGNVFRAAENHYGGHVFVIGFDNGRDRVVQTKEIINSINASELTYDKIALRTMIYSKGVLHFAGDAVKQKYVFGIDWENERSGFSGLDFAEGNANIDSLDNGILISASVAQELKARVGDDVVLEIPTKSGQKNTGVFVVKGIMRDNSIFGYYKCYISRDKLNSLVGFAPDDCSWIGFYFDQNDSAYLLDRANSIHTILSPNFSVGSIVNTREEYARETADETAVGFRYAFVTLNAYISEVSDLLDGMKLISYFLYIMMIVIALVSMSVTYRLILYERAKEIGTIRVMGMKTFGTQAVLVIEYAIMFVIALFIGFLLALFIIWILSLFSYSQIPGFDIFLQNGKLTASFPAGLIITNVLILLFTTLPAVWLPAAGISKAQLTIILSGNSHAK